MKELPDINAIRRRNLRIVVERTGSIGEFCERMGVSRQRLHILICPKAPRNIGDSFARRVEEVFGFAKNWMDHVNKELSETADILAWMDTEPSDSEKLLDLKRELARAQKKTFLEILIQHSHNNKTAEYEDEEGQR